jgi:hypothetical protein
MDRANFPNKNPILEYSGNILIGLICTRLEIILWLRNITIHHTALHPKVVSSKSGRFHF